MNKALSMHSTGARGMGTVVNLQDATVHQAVVDIC